MSLTTRLTYAAILPAFLPMHVLMQGALRSAIARARKAPRVPRQLARDATTLDLPSAKQVDPPVELDYLEHRSSAYIGALVLDSAWEAARALTGENAAEEPTDEAFARDMLGSIAAFLIARAPEDDAWVLDSAFMRAGRWWNHDRFEIARFVFEIPAGRYEIHDVHGRVHRPGDPTWKGARRKLIAQVSLWVPAVGHAWAHFWLPDVVAATVHESLPRHTNLYRLLAPHTRFANRHNHTGLWIQRASDNQPTLAMKLVPWKANPIRALDFRSSVMEAASRYHRSGNHFDYPERIDRRIPYFAMLGAYFDVTERFVEELAVELEADAYADWAAKVDAWYPGFAQVPMTRAIAMVLWHMGIAHGADHLSYVGWARRYGTCEVDPSIEELSAREPSTYARYRFLAFLNNFADYRPSPAGIDLRLVTSDAAYGFAPGSHAEAAAKRWIAALRRVDGELAAEGNAVVRLDAMIRAICF